MRMEDLNPLSLMTSMLIRVLFYIVGGQRPFVHLPAMGNMD